MFLFFYFILKFGNYDFFILVCFIYIKCIGYVKVGIVCDEFIKYFLIRLFLMNFCIIRIFIIY